MPKAPTATLVANLKRRAKELSRSGSISHSEALERMAAEAGYRDWHALLQARSAAAASPATEPISVLPVDPKLRPGFDSTPNDERNEEEILAWWDRPYALTLPDGSLEVRCLDGGAWDRSTWYGVAPDMASAMKLADEKLARWRKARGRPSSMLDGDLIRIVRVAASRGHPGLGRGGRLFCSAGMAAGAWLY
ncbi:glyoxalase superfamily protein [Cupriavidus necator]